MESNNFDKQIRKKLQDLEVGYQPEDWSLMEQKLNNAAVEASPEYEDVLLDGVAYGSLENYKADFEPSHWNLMEQKLDEDISIRRKIYRYKIVEVSLMLLVIFTLIQFLPFKKQNTSTTSGELKNTIENQIDKDLKQSAEKSDVAFVHPEISKTETTTTVTDQQIQANTTKNYSTKSPALRTVIGFKYKSTTADESFGFIKKSNLNELSTNSRLALSLDRQPSEKDFEVEISFPLLLPIDVYEPDKLSITGFGADLPICAGCEPINSKVLVSIGMMGGADVDYITTPYDDQYHQKEFAQVAMGYSGGFTVGIKYHKWELETGALYAAKYYGSRNIFEVNGSFEEGGYVQQGLLGVQLDIVKVPVHLRYNFMSDGKWNFYAHSGASFNMTVETLYEYTSEKVGNSSIAFVSRSANPHTLPNHDGVFEGGDLIDNTFITANLGLGVERHLNTRMSVFLGSTYQHQITKGLGPQSDKINSLSIMAGVRVTLKSKKRR